MWLSQIDSSDTRSALDREPCFRVTQTASGPSSSTGRPPQCGFQKSTPPTRDQYWTENPASESPKQPPVHRAVLDSLRNVALTNRLLRYEISIGPRTLLQSHPNSLRSIEQYWTASAMWLSEIDSSDTRSVLDREPCFRVTQTASGP